MNTHGSYRALRNNSTAALLSAIEIYNKPRIEYRDECFVILLINAWELLFKAILSKHRQRIYYPKKRNVEYRTLSIEDALSRLKVYFPASVEYEPVAKNIELLLDFRNNAIHFYNQPGFGVIIYGLAQTSIINYRDLTTLTFGTDIADEMTLALLPLSYGSQPNPIEFLQNASANPPKSRSTGDFLKRMRVAIQDLETYNHDTGRFLMLFTLKLESVKKITSADFVVGVASHLDDPALPVVVRPVDPNISHPLRQKEILEAIGSHLDGVKFSAHSFQAIAWKTGIKITPHLCWTPKAGGSPMYSRDVLSILKKMSRAEIESAVAAYNADLQKRRR